MQVGENGIISGSSLDMHAASEIVTAIKFFWGGDDPAVLENSIGYVAGTNDVNISSFSIGDLLAMPEIQVDMGKQQGGSKDSPVDVEMKLVDPITEIVAGYMYQPIWCSIFEFNPSDPDNTCRQMFYGKISNVIINKNGRADVISFRVNGNKYQLDRVILGLRASTNCQWTLGSDACDIDLTALYETPEITAVDGRTVTVDALTTTTSRYWQGGWMRFEKMFVGIRSYTGGLTFETFRPINPGMVGETITMAPGCDKTIDTCRSRFANENRFGGFGYAIPAYTPIWENG